MPSFAELLCHDFIELVVMSVVLYGLQRHPPTYVPRIYGQPKGQPKLSTQA